MIIFKRVYIVMVSAVLAACTSLQCPRPGELRVADLYEPSPRCTYVLAFKQLEGAGPQTSKVAVTNRGSQKGPYIINVSNESFRGMRPNVLQPGKEYVFAGCGLSILDFVGEATKYERQTH